MSLLSRHSLPLIVVIGFLLYALTAAALTETIPSRSSALAGGASADAEAPSSGGLRPDQIYAVLVAEIAGRRGDMETAFANYYHAAELTGSPQMAELAVRAAISADDQAAADRGIELWLGLDSDSLSALQVAAFLRIRAEDLTGALIHLDRLIALAPDDETAFAKAAAIVSRVSDQQQRVSLMESLVSRHSSNADAQQSLAMVAASVSQFEVAEQAARRAMELRPDWNAPRMFLVRLLISEDKRAEARTLLEGFVNASPDDHALRMLYGQFLVEEEELASARDVFERMLRNQPKEPDVLFAVGVLSLQLDDLDGARLHFKRLFETGEREDEAAFYLGQTAERDHDSDSALDWYAKVRGANADDAQVRIAVLKAQGGDVVEAREILQRLRGESPDNAIPFFMVEAEILDEVGRMGEVLSVYDDALASFPNNLSLLYARGLYLIKHDKIAEGERDLRVIIAADPHHADALNALGYTLADRTSRLQEARGLIERAYALKPDEPAILDSMGWINYRLGNLEAARDFLEKALDQFDDGEIAAHLGEVLWTLGRRTEAWAVWDKALEGHPDHVYLKGVVGRFRVSKSESRAKGDVSRATSGDSK